MQQLTCNIDLSCSFYYLFFSFVLLELKPFVLKGKVLEEKVRKNVKKSVKNLKRWESAKVSHKRVLALLTPEIRS